VVEPAETGYRRGDAYGELGRFPAVHGAVERMSGVWPRPSVRRARTVTLRIQSPSSRMPIISMVLHLG